MRKLFLLPLPLLAGCVSDRDASSYVCNHQIGVRLSAETTLKASATIEDPVARQAAINAANTTLALADACPPTLALWLEIRQR